MIETQNIKPRMIILLVGLFLLLLAGLPQAAQANTPLPTVQVLVDGEPLISDVPPVIINDRTFVPLRAVGEAVGGQVHWDAAQRRAIVQLHQDILIIPLGEHFALLNGAPVPLDVPAQIIGDRTMVPLRFIVEALGARLEWNHNTRTVTIFRKATRITGMTYTRGTGKAQVVLTFSEPLKGLTPGLEEEALQFRLSSAVPDLPQPVLAPLDPLVKRMSLTPDGNDTVLQIELWSAPVYRHALSPDGTRLTVEIDYLVTGMLSRTENRILVVDINTSGPVKYTTSVLRQPDRLVVDIEGVTLAAGAPASVEVGQGYLTRIRAAQFSRNPNTVRVVLDLGAGVVPEVTTTDYGLKLRFIPQVTAITAEQVQGKTRLTLGATMPLDAQVTLLPDKKSLRIQIPQGSSRLAQPTLAFADGAVSQVAVAPGADQDSLVVTVLLPYYIGHQVVSKSSDSRLVLEFVASPVYGKRIYIDPGHGGSDPGAISPIHRIFEKTLNLDVSLALKKSLEEAGAHVLMIRTTDVDVSLQERVRMVNSASPPADIFISVHHNSAANTAARGIETYYWHTNPKSRTLAEHIHAAMVQGLDFPDRRVRTEEFYVIKHITIPSILVELGYLTNSDEEKALMAQTYATNASNSIKDGIFAYFWQEIGP